jgi:hypothetical protein
MRRADYFPLLVLVIVSRGLRFGGRVCPHILAAPRASPLRCSSCFHTYGLSFSAWLASHLATSSSRVTPLISLHRYPRPYNISTGGIKIKKERGRHWGNQKKASSSRLTQRLMTPSLKETGSGPMCQFTPSARIPRTRVSTSACPNSAWKERSGQPGSGYLQIVISHRRSSWM